MKWGLSRCGPANYTDAVAPAKYLCNSRPFCQGSLQRGGSGESVFAFVAKSLRSPERPDGEPHEEEREAAHDGELAPDGQHRPEQRDAAGEEAAGLAEHDAAQRVDGVGQRVD